MSTSSGARLDDLFLANESTSSGPLHPRDHMQTEGQAHAGAGQTSYASTGTGASARESNRRCCQQPTHGLQVSSRMMFSLVFVFVQLLSTLFGRTTAWPEHLQIQTRQPWQCVCEHSLRHPWCAFYSELYPSLFEDAGGSREASAAAKVVQLFSSSFTCATAICDAVLAGALFRV